MKKNNFSGKTLEEAKISALENLKCNEEDIYINETGFEKVWSKTNKRTKEPV